MAVEVAKLRDPQGRREGGDERGQGAGGRTGPGTPGKEARSLCLRSHRAEPGHRPPKTRFSPELCPRRLRDPRRPCGFSEPSLSPSLSKGNGDPCRAAAYGAVVRLKELNAKRPAAGDAGSARWGSTPYLPRCDTPAPCCPSSLGSAGLPLRPTGTARCRPRRRQLAGFDARLVT